MSTETRCRAAAWRRYALNGPTMGSRWSSVFFAPPDFDPTQLRRDLQAAVDQVDDQMSTWKPTSDLSRLNAAPLGRWIGLPAELMTVLAAALDVGAASQGAFDVGVGDLVEAWGFGAVSCVPDPDRIARSIAQRAFAAPQTLQIDRTNRCVRKHAPLSLDLSAIAKGFGVDQLAGVMAAHGIGSWLVGIDGEMRARGTKPGGQIWAIAHERPCEGTREIAGILEIADCAVATSGDYRHVVEADGRRVSHTMDPRRNAPAASDLASVTVLAETCMAADAWATAILVSGKSVGTALARRAGLRVLAVDTCGVVEWLTDNLPSGEAVQERESRAWCQADTLV